MALSKIIEKNERVAVLIAAGGMLLAAFLVYRNLTRASRAVEVWYYDLNTKTLVAGQSDDISPISTGSDDYTYHDGTGGAAVQAAIFGCGSPPSLRVGMDLEDIKSAGGLLAYVSRYPVETARFYKNLQDGQPVDEQEYVRHTNAPKLIAKPTELKWVPIQSEAGTPLLGAAGEYCGASGERPVPAIP